MQIGDKPRVQDYLIGPLPVSTMPEIINKRHAAVDVVHQRVARFGLVIHFVPRVLEHVDFTDINRRPLLLYFMPHRLRGCEMLQAQHIGFRPLHIIVVYQKHPVSPRPVIGKRRVFHADYFVDHHTRLVRGNAGQPADIHVGNGFRGSIGLRSGSKIRIKILNAAARGLEHRNKNRFARPYALVIVMALAHEHHVLGPHTPERMGVHEKIAYRRRVEVPARKFPVDVGDINGLRVFKPSRLKLMAGKPLRLVHEIGMADDQIIRLID